MLGDDATIDPPIGSQRGLRLGVFVDGDGFTRKRDGWSMDWEEAATWPFKRDEVTTSNRIFINTRPNSGRSELHKAFEQSAKIAGFQVIHRTEKIGESSSRNGYTKGSRAVLGASISWLAPHLDVAIVHDHCEETTNAIEFVLGKHDQIEVIMVTSRPCSAAKILANSNARFSISDPRPHRDVLEFTGRSSRKREIFRQRISFGTGINGTAKIIDGASFTNIARAVSDIADTIYDSKKLSRWIPDGCPPRTESHYVSSDREVVSTDKKLAMRIWEQEGWEVFQIKIGKVGTRMKAMDDGIIGAMIADLAIRFSHVVLFSADRDFIPVVQFLTKMVGTKFFTVAPPILTKGHNITSRELVNNQFSEFISAFELPARVYHVPETLFSSKGLSRVRMNQSGPSRRKNMREERQNIRENYVNRLVSHVDRLKVHDPSPGESRILASAATGGT